MWNSEYRVGADELSQCRVPRGYVCEERAPNKGEVHSHKQITRKSVYGGRQVTKWGIVAPSTTTGPRRNRQRAYIETLESSFAPRGSLCRHMEIEHVDQINGSPFANLGTTGTLRSRHRYWAPSRSTFARERMQSITNVVAMPARSRRVIEWTGWWTVCATVSREDGGRSADFGTERSARPLPLLSTVTRTPT